MHGNAKEINEIDNEKEIIEISTVQAMQKNKYGNITKTDMEECMDKNAGEGKTEVIENENTVVVKFLESNRYYEIDNNGNVSAPIEVIIDEYAGDLSKGGRCDGSKETPFEINCIEDLVVFSIMTNGGDTELGINSNKFSGKYVALNKTLDFKSMFSYNNYATTKYGDLNTDGKVENLKIELTDRSNGCIGFKGIKSFAGIFDGKENEIKNIYQNVVDYGGLFESLGGGTVKNVKISGIIIANIAAGGIVGEKGGNINNCINYAKIEGKSAAGGICGDKFSGDILNCINYGEISSDFNSNYGVGGIIGNNSNTCNIYNCVNYGKVTYTGTRSSWYFGGAGGIIGLNRGTLNNLINVVNFGEIASTSYKGGICGMDLYFWQNETEMNATNALFVEQNDLKGIGSMESTKVEVFEKSDIQNVVNTLNQYIEQNSSNTIDWKKWKIRRKWLSDF